MTNEESIRNCSKKLLAATIAAFSEGIAHIPLQYACDKKISCSQCCLVNEDNCYTRWLDEEEKKK